MKTFGKIHGDVNKRIPVEFQEIFNIEPLLLISSFIIYRNKNQTSLLK